jgi:hypothetical protein
MINKDGNTVHYFSKDEYISYENGAVYFIEKPLYRIQCDYHQGTVIGFWLWTCNSAAIKLNPSTYYEI